MRKFAHLPTHALQIHPPLGTNPILLQQTCALRDVLALVTSNRLTHSKRLFPWPPPIDVRVRSDNKQPLKLQQLPQQTESSMRLAYDS